MSRFHTHPLEVKFIKDTTGIDLDAPNQHGTTAPLETVEARYKDLLDRLGVQGHDGAISEINALRAKANLNP